MTKETSTNELNPLIGVDVARLEQEMERYQTLLDEQADHAYSVAEEARNLGLDPNHSLKFLGQMIWLDAQKNCLLSTLNPIQLQMIYAPYLPSMTVKRPRL